MYAVLYIPAGTTRAAGDRIAAAALAHAARHDLVIVALAWTAASAAAIIAGRWAQAVIAVRPTTDLDRAVRAAGGHLATLRPAPARPVRPLEATLEAMVAAGRIDPAVAAELLAATSVARAPGRRTVRLRRPHDIPRVGT